MQKYYGAERGTVFWPFFLTNLLGVALAIGGYFLPNTSLRIPATVAGLLILGYNAFSARYVSFISICDNQLVTFNRKRTRFVYHNLHYVTKVSRGKTIPTIGGPSETIRLEFGGYVRIIQNDFYKNWAELKAYLLNLPLYSGEVPKDTVQTKIGLPSREELIRLGV